MGKGGSVLDWRLQYLFLGSAELPISLYEGPGYQRIPTIPFRREVLYFFWKVDVFGFVCLCFL